MMLKLFYLRKASLLVGDSYDIDSHRHHLIDIFTAFKNHSEIKTEGRD